MFMKSILATLIAFAIGSIPTGAASRPNILYIYVDDMGWGSIGPNAQFERKAAGKPYVRTPNLDKLAARSVNFTRSYGCTVCSPARSSQQTGFHQGHTFADRNDPDNAKKAIRSEDVTMGDALSRAGYTTGYWGKWGYGGSKDMKSPTIDNVQTLPSSHGYQHVLAELHHVRAHTFFQPTLWKAPAKPGAIGGLELVPNSMAAYKGKAQYSNLPALQNHAGYPDVAYCDDAYCFAALDFVRDSAQSGKPFFGLLAVQVPHAPFGEITELPDWDKAYADDKDFASLNKQSQQWAAMVTRIDAHLGNIFKALEDPNNDGDDSDSVVANTLIIFQSDNGGPGGPANKELDTNGGLRGTKGSIYEGGIRVPTLISWPNSNLKAGTSSDRVIDITDLLPTFCELAGAESPIGLDGVSLVPTLTGQGEQRTRDYVIHEAGKGKSIIRGKDKLIWTKKGVELYDLEKDRAETTNVAKTNQKLVKELKSLLLKERVDEPKGFANTYHRWIGQNGDATSSPDNWSDYKYSNVGNTYLEDAGAPQLSWSASIDNGTAAKADKDLEFLGLDIRSSRLDLATGINLTARNELRITDKAILTIDGGTVSSSRWVDVKAGGEVRGNGEIAAALYNAGTVNVASSGDAKSKLLVEGNYTESASATLAASAGSKITISGNASLAGKLEFHVDKKTALKPGVAHSIIRADRITGKFANAEDRIVTKDGTKLIIGYSENEVTLTVEDAASGDDS